MVSSTTMSVAVSVSRTLVVASIYTKLVEGFIHREFAVGFVSTYGDLHALFV